VEDVGSLRLLDVAGAEALQLLVLVKEALQRTAAEHGLSKEAQGHDGE
jgi:hypothetical protein